MKKLYNFLEAIVSLFKDTEIWVYPISSFFALLAGVAYYSQVNTRLENFDERIIGIVVLQGIDAGVRTMAYVKIIVIYVVVLFACITILSLLNRAIFLKSRAFEIEKSGIFYLAVVYHFAFLLSLIDPLANLKPAQFVLVYAIVVNTLLLFIKSTSYRRNKNVYTIFSDKTINLISLFSPFACVVVLRGMLGKDLVLVSENYLLVYLGLWVVYYLLYGASLQVLVIGLRVERTLASKSIAYAILPFFTLPFLLLISNEIQYFLSRYGYLIGVRWIVLFFIALILLAGFRILIMSIRFSMQWLPYKKISGLLFFIAILTIVSYTNYIGQYDIPVFDMFHTGERLLPTHQMFSYGKLPFTDILPTHGGSDFVLDTLFSRLNNGFSLDVLSWDWLRITIYAILVYVILSFVFAPSLSFLIVLITSASFVQTHSYGVLALLLIQLPGIFSRYLNYKSLIFYWATVWFVMFWRIDFGVLTIIVSLIVITVNLVFSSGSSGIPTNRKLHFHLYSFITVALFAGFVMVIFLWISYGNPIETLKIVISFLKIQTQSVSYAELSKYAQNITVMNYIVLPALTLYYPIRWIILKIRRDEIDQRTTSLTFIAIFMLMIFTRAFQRHSLMENVQLGLFILLIAAFPMIFVRKKEIAFLLTLGILSVYYLAMPSVKPPLLDKRIQLKTWTLTEHRVHENRAQYEIVSNFLSAQLAPWQTFYDFSNNPLLYVVTDREFIPYIIPNLYIISEKIQSEELQRLKAAMQQGKVPFVLFFSPYSFNQVDGVPNEVRSYRFTEFIYQNYHPSINVDGYALWAQNGYNINSSNLSDTSFKLFNDIDQHFDLGLLPYYWGNFDPLKATKNTKIVQPIISEPVIITQNIPVAFSIEADISKIKGNYIYLRIMAKQEALVTVSYGQDNIFESSLKFKTIPKDAPVDYLIRVSTQWDWVSKLNDTMTISSDLKIDVIDLNIREGD